MELVTTSVQMTTEQREKLGLLVEWMRCKSIGEVLRELVEMEFSKQALLRSEFDGPMHAGEGVYQLD